MDMCAGAEKIAALGELVASQLVDVKALLASGFKLPPTPDAIPLLEACGTIEGQYEGERRMFRLPCGAVELYAWASGTWEKVGAVVMGDEKQPFRGVVPKQRFFFDGEEWDYLFDIDFGGGRAAKLPYRSGESVFDAAQRFINNNSSLGAHQGHKEQLQNHIMQGLSEEDLAKIGVATGAAGGANGGPVAYSAYAREAAEMAARGVEETPSWGQAKRQFESRGTDVAVSTFAQEEAAAARAAASGGGSAGASLSTPPPNVSASPHRLASIEPFLPLDPAAVKKKTAELAGSDQFNSTIDAAAAVVAAKGSDAAALVASVGGLAALYAALSQGSRFPALDLLRYVASCPAGARHIASPDARCAELVDTALFASDKSFTETTLTSEPERLVALRLIANVAAFGPSSGGDDADKANVLSFLVRALACGVRPMARRPATNANQKLAISAALQNMAVHFGAIMGASTAEEGEGIEGAAAEGAYFVREFFSAVAEAVLFEKDTAAQAKYLAIANTAIVAACGPAGSSAAAAAAPLPCAAAVKAYATKTLQRFCQGTLRHVDQSLSAAAAAVFQHVKPSNSQFE